MSKKLTYKQYQALVEKQSKALLEALANVATGNPEHNIEIPDGISPLSDLAIGISYLVEDLRSLLEDQAQAQNRLEEEVQERTKELEHALDESRNIYSRYVSREWEDYANESQEEIEESNTLLLTMPDWQPTMTRAIDEKAPVANVQNGHANGHAGSVAVPISYGDELIGLLGFAQEDPDWDDDDLAAVEEIAEQVGLALENQRLFDQTQTALAETEQLAANLSRLNEMATAVNTAASFDEVYKLSVQQTMDIFQRYMVSICLLDDADASGMLYSRIRESKEVSVTPDHSLAGGLTHQAWQRRQFILVPDTRANGIQLSEWESDLVNSQGANSLMIAPIIIRGRSAGTINIVSRRTDAFTQNDESLIRQIAALIASTIENRRLTEETQHRAELLEKLSKTEAQLSLATNPNDVTEALATLFFPDKKDKGLVILQYINLSRQGRPQTYRIVSAWQNHGFLPDSTPLIGEDLSIRLFGRSAEKVVETPNQVYFAPYLQNNPDFSSDTQQYLGSFDAESVAITTLRSGGQWQGALTICWPDERQLHPDDQFFIERLIEPLAAVIGGIRATEAQRVALAETASLYSASLSLNRAETEDNILQVFDNNLKPLDPISLSIWNADLNDSDQVEWFEMTGVRRHRIAQAAFEIGSRAQAKNFKFLEKLDMRSGNVMLVSDPANDPRTADDDNLHAILKINQATSAAFLPLLSGGRWAGLVIILWDKIYDFSDADERLLGTLSAQASNTLAGIRLLRETQERADQLAQLTQVEQNLSLARTETQVVQAVADAFADMTSINLSYFDIDMAGQPDFVYPACHWREGEFTVRDPMRQSGGPLSLFGAANYLIESDLPFIHFSNIMTDERTDENTRATANENGLVGATVVGLRSGGIWQGLLSIGRTEAYELSARDRFILQNLAESIGAVVARRRAQRAQQEARRESEMLYEASRDINAAGDNIQEIVSVIGRLGDAPKFNRAELLQLSYDQSNQLEALTVTGNWHNGAGTQPTPQGIRYTRSMLSNIDFAIGGDQLFISNLANDNRLSQNARSMLDKQNVHALGVLPLWAGNRQIAVILLLNDEPVSLEEQDLRTYQSLAPQIAVALQNVLLLDAARDQAYREQLLREVTEKVRNASNVDAVMKTAVSEVGRILGRKAFVYLTPRSDE